MSGKQGGRAIGPPGIGRTIVGVTLLLKGDSLAEVFEAGHAPEPPSAGQARHSEKAPEPKFAATERVQLPDASPAASLAQAPQAAAPAPGSAATLGLADATASIKAPAKPRAATVSPQFAPSADQPGAARASARIAKRFAGHPLAQAAAPAEPSGGTVEAAPPIVGADALAVSDSQASAGLQLPSPPNAGPTTPGPPPPVQSSIDSGKAEEELAPAAKEQKAPEPAPTMPATSQLAVEANDAALPQIARVEPVSEPATEPLATEGAPAPLLVEAVPEPVAQASAGQADAAAKGAPASSDSTGVADATSALPKPSFAQLDRPRTRMTPTRHKPGPDTGSASPPQAPPSPQALKLAPELPPAAATALPQPAFGGAPSPDRQPAVRVAMAGETDRSFPGARPETSALPPPSEEPAAAKFAGRDTSPSVQPGQALFGPDDELILQIATSGSEMVDTMVAYGTRSGVYIPLGAFARFMDMAISVGDDGNYANGWFLEESKGLTIDLRKHSITVAGMDQTLAPLDAMAFEGELYLRADRYAGIFPLTLDVDLREQAIKVKTLVPFPYQERLAREARRDQLNGQQGADSARHWPREETPYRVLTFPVADAELRAVTDSTLGKRIEGELRLAGDLAFMNAQGFVTGSSRDGVTGARIELGRRDPDGDLLGPLKATEFEIGDVNTDSLPVGLRGTGGRGAYLANKPLESASVFEKIDLRGELPDGYEVELYRNNVLIDSTAKPVNGQYEFLQVPVENGLNVFRFVFFGPQGQRREEVRQISVGDGRLAKGQFVYAFGAVQKGINVFNAHGPLYSPIDDEGSWRASGMLQYGVTSSVTAVLGGAWFQTGGRKNWMGSAGLRTGISGIAAKLDFGMQSGGGKAVQLGLGGSLMGATYTLSHAEYRGLFNDEVNSPTNIPLRRASEFDLNTTLQFGSESGPFYLPVSAQVRRLEYLNGQQSLEASLRSSARLGSFMLSNTIDYDRASGPNGFSSSQLRGGFDLATITGSRLQFRAGTDFSILPNPHINTVKLDVDYALDHATLLRGSVSHGFDPSQTQFGLSAVRKFGKFTLAFEGDYAVPRHDYSASLRFGFAFGRNPLTGRYFFDRPGLSSGGAVAIRAFSDDNGDGRFDQGDTLLPEVEFGNGTNHTVTDSAGRAFLGNMGDSHPVSFKVNLETLPDIALSPKSEGIEFVPRPGRIHVADFAVRTLGEVEGTAYFSGAGANKGVSGLALELRDHDGNSVARARTEADGFFLFEQVPPGNYAVAINSEQAERLKIHLAKEVEISVDPKGSVARSDITVVQD